jgi:hypothetical protein
MKQNLENRKNAAVFTIAVLTAIPSMMGCSDEGMGSLQVFVEAEASITGGVDPGTGDENIADGWGVTYDEFLVTIGNVRAARTDTDATLSDASTFVLDLKQVPANGYVITEMNAVSGTWYKFGFDMPSPTAETQVLAPTSAMDKDLLNQGGYSLYIAGAIENANGMSCPPGDPDPAKCVAAPKITFRWGFPAATSFDDCATVDGTPGFAIPSGGTAPVAITIHGDHWFFNNITAGVEIVTRYAQYIADCDLNHDGETTIDELKQVPAADVFPSPKYNLSGSFSGPIKTAYDYVLAQARTIGDFQGDGECPTRKVLP